MALLRFWLRKVVGQWPSHRILLRHSACNSLSSVEWGAPLNSDGGCHKGNLNSNSWWWVLKLLTRSPSAQQRSPAFDSGMAPSDAVQPDLVQHSSQAPSHSGHFFQLPGSFPDFCSYIVPPGAYELCCCGPSSAVRRILLLDYISQSTPGNCIPIIVRQN